jgi:anti-anti-sigma factor
MPTQTWVDHGHAVLTVSGRLILGREVEELETVVAEQLRLGHRRFVFDLASLDYLDSSGIGAIVSCLAKVKRTGGELRMAGLNTRLERMFKMTGVDTLFAIYPTVTEAVAG